MESVCDRDTLTGPNVYQMAKTVNMQGGDTLLWISKTHLLKQHTKNVLWPLGDNHDFPRTVVDAKKTPYWPMVRDSLESEIKGNLLTITHGMSFHVLQIAE